MFFTQEDYRKIEEYLRQNSKKDTDFPTTEEIHDEDYVPIIQDSTNKKMTVQDLRLGLSKGPAYECAVRHGYVGTEEEWLASLDGKSAYQIAVELGYVGTEEEWIASLKGDKGDDGSSPILRISPDGQSLEISSDGGQTWLPFEKNFNKLRVIGYVDSVDLLPRNAIVGDIYGVWNPDVYSGRVDEEGHLIKGAYDLYINTVKAWVEDYLITRVYSYDTELPSTATDGTTVLVPVKYLTLDKEKIDGYKVYRYSFASRGWTMLLNTSEIFASKEDIINHGDNLYALVQGDLQKVSDTINNWINGTLDGTESYQEDNTSIIGTYALDANIKAIRYNIAPGYTVDIRILSDEQFNPSEIAAPNVLCGTEGAVIGSGKLNIPEGAKSLIAIIKKADTSEEELPVSAGSYLSLYHEVATTYKLYRRVVDWVFFGTNASITYHLIQNIQEGSADNILSGLAVKDAINVISKGTNMTLTANPSIVYKGVATVIALTAQMKKSTPTNIKILDGVTVLANGSNNPLVYTSPNPGITLNADKTFTTEGTAKNVIFEDDIVIQARYPIYYGFAANATALAVEANRYDPTTTAVHTYTKTNDIDDQHFYILVPSDISGLSIFTMGGAPFVMNTERTETINGISYKVYESAYTYNVNVTLKVSAS